MKTICKAVRASYWGLPPETTTNALKNAVENCPTQCSCFCMRSGRWPLRGQKSFFCTDSMKNLPETRDCCRSAVEEGKGERMGKPKTKARRKSCLLVEPPTAHAIDTAGWSQCIRNESFILFVPVLLGSKLYLTLLPQVPSFYIELGRLLNCHNRAGRFRWKGGPVVSTEID